MSKINLSCALFVLEEMDSKDVRKANDKRIKLVMNSDNTSLINVKYKGESSIDEEVKNKVTRVLNTECVYIKQVLTLGYNKHNEKGINVLYIAVTNKANVKLDSDYKLVDFDVQFNKVLILNKKEYCFIKDNDLFKFRVRNKEKEASLLTSLICYNYLRENINSEIIFKFLKDKFTIDDVHSLYETILNEFTDKSNFRKRIIKYLYETKEMGERKGYRPSKLYTFCGSIE